MSFCGAFILVGMVIIIVELIFFLSLIEDVMEIKQNGQFYMGFLERNMMEINPARGFYGFLEINFSV